MDVAKKLLEKAQAAGKVAERTIYLKLTDAIEVEGVKVNKPNGPHRIKIVPGSEKIVTGKNAFSGKEEKKLHMVVVEAGKQKIWEIAIQDAQGNASYLVEQLAEVEAGEELVVEAKRTGKGKTFIDIRKVVGAEPEVPAINLDDDGTSQKDPSGDEGNEDIPLDDLPF